MKISQKGIQLIKHFESCYLNAYLDCVKVPTIGWGTICYPNRKPVRIGDICTQEQAEEWLMFELEEKQVALSKYITADITQTQFDALMSFAYNLGTDALRKSTLLRYINQGGVSNHLIIGDDNISYKEFGRGGEFLRWCRTGGVPNKGIVRRRKSEAWFFSTGELRFFKEMLIDDADAATYISKKKI